MSPQCKMYLMLCILLGHVYNLFWRCVYIFMGMCVKDTQMSPQSYVTDSLYCNHVVYVTVSYDPKTCVTLIVPTRTANEIEVLTATANEMKSPQDVKRRQVPIKKYYKITNFIISINMQHTYSTLNI